MKKLNFAHPFGLAGLGLLAALISLPAYAIKTGESAPAFTLKDADGKTHSLSGFKGKYVVLEWYNKDCPFVRKHYDSKNMQKLQSATTGKGVVWLQINSAAAGKQGYLDPAATKKQAAKEGAVVTAQLLDTDGAVGKAYEAKTTPHMYVINPEGKLVYMGAIDSISSADKEDVSKAKNYVKNALDEVMNGKAVSVATTSAYGCSIKYAN